MVDMGRIDARRNRPEQGPAARTEAAPGNRAYEFGQLLVGLQAGALDRAALRDGVEEAGRFADFVRRHRRAPAP